MHAHTHTHNVHTQCPLTHTHTHARHVRVQGAFEDAAGRQAAAMAVAAPSIILAQLTADADKVSVPVCARWGGIFLVWVWLSVG